MADEAQLAYLTATLAVLIGWMANFRMSWWACEWGGRGHRQYTWYMYYTCVHGLNMHYT